MRDKKRRTGSCGIDFRPSPPAEGQEPQVMLSCFIFVLLHAAPICFVIYFKLQHFDLVEKVFHQSKAVCDDSMLTY